MADKSFYKNYGPFQLQEIEKEFDCVCIGDNKIIVQDVSVLENSDKNKISFFSNKKYFNSFINSQAGTIIVDKKYTKKKTRH